MACNDNPRLFPQWRWIVFGLSYRKIVPQWSDVRLWFFIFAVIASSYVASMIVPTVLLIFWPNCSDICAALLITLGVRLSLICRVLLFIRSTPLGCLLHIGWANLPASIPPSSRQNQEGGKAIRPYKVGVSVQTFPPSRLFWGRVHLSLRVTTASASTTDLLA